LFEKNEIGGTCLNRGCIPTKSLLHCAKIYSEVKNASKLGINSENISYDYSVISAKKNDVVQKIRKSLTQLIESYGVEIVNAGAKIKDKNTITSQGNSYECKNIIIATGSIPNTLDFKGEYSRSFVLNSDDILSLDKLPDSILIVGSGAIGIEWARIFSELDKKVSVVEIAQNLVPIADVDVSNRIERIFKRKRIDYYLNTSIEMISGTNVLLSNQKQINVDCILVAAGRSALKLNDDYCSKNIDMNKFIDTDKNNKTSIDNIYAIGDVNGKSMLAHSAIHQAIEAVENIKNNIDSEFCPNLVPSVIYGSPEIAWIGFTEQKLIERGITYNKSLFPIAALGKAQADNDIEGFVKILADDKKILGAHIVSNEASALIQQVAIAINNNISPAD
jgi:dihydrolipoamide dehydrogenase